MKLRRKVKNNARLQMQTNNEKEPNKRNWARIIKYVFYTVLLLIVLYAVLASPLLKISSIEVEGGDSLSASSIENQVKGIISSSPISENILFVSPGSIEEKLKKDNYQIGSLVIEKKYPNTIRVIIKEQKPNILWTSAGTSYVVAVDGRAYRGEVTAKMKEDLAEVVDSTNLPVKEGEKLVADEFVRFAVALKRDFALEYYTIQRFQIGETTTDIDVVTTEGLIIKFDATRELKVQMSSLSDVLSTIKKQGKKASEYIDLRINGRVFYK